MSRTTDAMTWFRTTFGNEIEAALVDTPFDLDLLTAVAYQETGYIWQSLFDKMGAADVLKLCVGDTLDSPNRKAFPINKAALLAEPNGQQMFDIARKSLEAMAAHVPGYAGAVSNPKKFCHGFGIFQYDLQFFKHNPDYFLDRKWQQFSEALKKAVTELKASLKRAYPDGNEELTPTEMVFVAIAYNRGRVDFSKGFKQGHRDSDGVYYGEHIWNYLNLAKTLPRPVPPTGGPRLILARHANPNESGWQYKAMATGTLVGGRFELDKKEFDAFLKVKAPGATRQPLRAMLTALDLQFLVEDKHRSHPTDPRVYVFVSEPAGQI